LSPRAGLFIIAAQLLQLIKHCSSLSSSVAGAFQAKWLLVRVKKTRQIKIIEPPLLILSEVERLQDVFQLR
jgi:hypothetical protein